MDCSSEENLIRMKLDDVSSISHLDFNIPNRKLTVFHQGQADPITQSLEDLNLGCKTVSSEPSEDTFRPENSNQKKLTLDSFGH